MKKLINKITKRVKWVFFTCPSTAVEWAEQNENRMTYIVNFMIFVVSLFVIFTTIFHFTNG